MRPLPNIEGMTPEEVKTTLSEYHHQQEQQLEYEAEQVAFHNKLISRVLWVSFLLVLVSFVSGFFLVLNDHGLIGVLAMLPCAVIAPLGLGPALSPWNALWKQCGIIAQNQVKKRAAKQGFDYQPRDFYRPASQQAWRSPTSLGL